MREKKGSIIVWPAYLDSKLSRAEGRRIPANLAAPDVTASVLKKAADLRGFDSEIEEGKRYPRQGFDRGGYLIIENHQGHKKGRMLLMLAKGVRRVVAEREAARQAAQQKGKSKKGKKGKKGRK
ncbi:MAG: signal recognition particle subunit SRP19/SEC65 family protein [Candidatus Thorarchaeota archaeon]|jgi:signal recognition particle subunit SRP19